MILCKRVSKGVNHWIPKERRKFKTDIFHDVEKAVDKQVKLFWRKFRKCVPDIQSAETEYLMRDSANDSNLSLPMTTHDYCV